MKVYRVTVIDGREGTCYGWASSKRTAFYKRLAMLAELGRYDELPEHSAEIEQIDVTANWLDKNFRRDNG